MRYYRLRLFKKYLAVGAVIGVIAGILIYIVLPQLLFSDLTYRQTFNKALGFPTDYYSPTGGGIYAVGFLPVIFAPLGAFFAFLLFMAIRPDKKIKGVPLDEESGLYRDIRIWKEKAAANINELYSSGDWEQLCVSNFSDPTEEVDKVLNFFENFYDKVAQAAHDHPTDRLPVNLKKIQSVLKDGFDLSSNLTTEFYLGTAREKRLDSLQSHYDKILTLIN